MTDGVQCSTGDCLMSVGCWMLSEREREGRSMAGPTMYTAVRLTREPGKDEFDRYFSVVWETAHELIDPARLFEEVTAQNGEIWALWCRPITPGWRSYVDQNKPVFLLMKHPTREPMVLSDDYSTGIRELSWTKEVN